jgi:hypothetical protein
MDRKQVREAIATQTSRDTLACTADVRRSAPSAAVRSTNGMPARPPDGSLPAKRKFVGSASVAPRARKAPVSSATALPSRPFQAGLLWRRRARASDELAPSGAIGFGQERSRGADASDWREEGPLAFLVGVRALRGGLRSSGRDRGRAWLTAA